MGRDQGRLILYLLDNTLTSMVLPPLSFVYMVVLHDISPNVFPLIAAAPPPFSASLQHVFNISIALTLHLAVPSFISSWIILLNETLTECVYPFLPFSEQVVIYVA